MPNIILIVFDTMRKDALSVYGGPVPTPNFESFSKEAVVYPSCITASPWTAPSHASLFLGKYPSEHGVHESYDSKMRDIIGMMASSKDETLTQWLKSQGYETVGISANPMLAVHNGFDRGFDSFGVVDSSTFTPRELLLLREASMGKTTKLGTVWRFVSRGRFSDLLTLYRFYRKRGKSRERFVFPNSPGGGEVVRLIEKMNLKDPFFLFVNFMEMHEPYTYYEKKRSNWAGFPALQGADLYGFTKIPDDMMSNIRRGYYARAAEADVHFGRLVSHLKNSGLFNDSLIIVTSDHGQALKEHGFYGHGTYLYDELAEVPLFVKYPQGERRTVGSGYQSLVNICRLVKAVVEGDKSVDPISDPTVFCESFGYQNDLPHFSDPPRISKLERARIAIDKPRRAIYRNGFKLTVEWPDENVQEFALKGKPLDPAENHVIVGSLMNDLHDFAKRKPSGELAPGVLSAEEEVLLSERLRQLGYE